jgi:hypothetical protein
MGNPGKEWQESERGTSRDVTNRRGKDGRILGSKKE